MVRALSTEDAKTHINAMQTIINGGLTEQIRTLDKHGQGLSNPNVWDGKLAVEFRSSWPETRKALENVIHRLDELHKKVHSINSDIHSAAGNA